LEANILLRETKVKKKRKREEGEVGISLCAWGRKVEGGEGGWWRPHPKKMWKRKERQGPCPQTEKG